MIEFPHFPKIARLSREIVITEKIDGTNASVFIREKIDGEAFPSDEPVVAVRGNLLIYAGSRTKWITPNDDNYGFARWVERNADQLASLGVGHHFGEWWGNGIQRKYDMQEKKFSLFNTHRWDNGETPRPECCDVVPILGYGIFSSKLIDDALEGLAKYGSRAAPGFLKPEGIVIYHTQGNLYFKKTLLKDEEWKGKGAVK